MPKKISIKTVDGERFDTTQAEDIKSIMEMIEEVNPQNVNGFFCFDTSTGKKLIKVSNIVSITVKDDEDVEA